MVKQTLVLGFAVFSGLLLFSASTYAEEVDCAIDPTSEACIVTTSDDTAADDLPPITSGDENLIFAGESSTVSDDSAEVIEEVEVEEDEEPALWPMYLSLGALGLAILVFLLLSLCSPKLKKK